MKHCYKCNQTLDISCFSKNKVKKDGHSSNCKKCQKIMKDAHYQSNKEAYKKRLRKNRKQIAEDFKKYKETLSCVICKENSTCCLDFHHVDPTKKELSISEFVHRCSTLKLKEELKKCVVVCANCHRKLHSNVIVLPIF